MGTVELYSPSLSPSPRCSTEDQENCYICGVGASLICRSYSFGRALFFRGPQKRQFCQVVFVFRIECRPYIVLFAYRGRSGVDNVGVAVAIRRRRSQPWESCCSVRAHLVGSSQHPPCDSW